MAAVYIRPVRFALRGVWVGAHDKGVYYGREGFVPNTHFVRAKNVDAHRGQFVDGFPDAESAVAVAIALMQKDAYQDVILIAVDSREALVRVFKGVQWFAEEDLNHQFPGSWRLVAEIEGEAAVSCPESGIARAVT